MFKTRARTPQTIICPKCLSYIEYTEGDVVCTSRYADDQECGYVLPNMYLLHYASYQPFFLQVFGWTKHGKTVFLDVMRLYLMALPKLWTGFNPQSLTQLDLDHEKILRREMEMGVMPGATILKRRAANEVYLVRLHNMPLFGSRTMAIMDHAGEMFQDMNVAADEMPFLMRTLSTFMVISLPRMFSENNGETMDQLLTIYLETMARNRIVFGKDRRRLVIVLTMADMIDLPPHLKNYLNSDDTWDKIHSSKPVQTWGDAELAAYMERMRWVSDEIKYWLRDDSVNAPGGASFVGLLDQYKIEARFSLISATGYDVESALEAQRMAGESNNSADSKPSAGIKITPRRVIDPLLWAIDYQSR